MSKIVSAVRANPVRAAYFVVIAVIVAVGVVQQVIAQHPPTLLAGVSIAATAVAGEIARAKVTPVAKLLDGESSASLRIVDELAGADTDVASAPVDPALEAQIPEAEQILPPAPVLAPVPDPGPAAAPVPAQPDVAALAGALVPQLVPAIVAELQRLGHIAPPPVA